MPRQNHDEVLLNPRYLPPPFLSGAGKPERVSPSWDDSFFPSVTGMMAILVRNGNGALATITVTTPDTDYCCYDYRSDSRHLASVLVE